MGTPEQNLLVLLLDRELYEKYSDLVDYKNIKETYRELSFLFDTLNVLHKEHERSFSVDELAGYFFTKYPDSDRQLYDGLFKQLSSIVISPEVGDSILRSVRDRKTALKLSEMAYKVANGSSPLAELTEFYDKEYNKVDHLSLLPIDETTQDLEYLIDHNYKETGLRWRLSCLNKSLGSLRDGDFGFIFARPETGKTTFLASEITGMLEGAVRPIVWFNNEEQGYKVMLRIYQAYFGVTTDQLLSNPKRFREEFIARTGGLFKLFDSATIARRDVEAIVSRTNPQLVIYDQIDKIKGFANDRDDLRLGAIYQWARELAKGSHAAIGVCQADGHGEGVRYLTMEHVANAKTSKQAEADFIVGIGKSTSRDDAMVRYLNISKNKLLGDPDSIDTLRHGSFETIISPQIARYEDVIQYN
jgi:replicative DNA helicase